jgi:predicted nucleic acid-binding Zn ribbon protein
MANIIDMGSNSGKANQRPTNSAKPQQINVDLNSAPELHCPKCDSLFFQEVTFFKKLSALMSPSGQETIIPVVAYACIECGTINPALLPVGFEAGGKNG